MVKWAVVVDGSVCEMVSLMKWHDFYRLARNFSRTDKIFMFKHRGRWRSPF